MEENRIDREQWKLCCSSAYKNEFVFFVQVGFLFMIAIFAMVQIVRGADNNEIYYSLLSSVIGIIFLPRVSTKNNNRI